MTLYELIWKEVGKKVGYGIDCDVTTDRLVDIFVGWLTDELEYEENELGYKQGWNDCLKEIREKLR